MSIERKQLTLKDGQVCEAIRLVNEKGHYVEVLTLGGVIKGIYVPDQQGVLENVVLAFDCIEDYRANGAYLNALIGRTAGRVQGGSITIDEVTYHLTMNKKDSTLHGGSVGIDKKVWELSGLDETINSITLKCECKHMEEGYPGNLALYVTYCFDNDSKLTITYDGVSDEKTVVNLTNHAYFNLSGNGKRRIEEHVLQVKADKVCELDAASFATGNTIDVEEEKVFDFRLAKKIGEEIDCENTYLKNAKGYDHPFILNEGNESVKLYDPISKRKLTVTTNQKAVVIYTMNNESEQYFTNGLKGIRRYGVCLETQGLPIGYNEVFKEESILEAGVHYKQVTSYQFSVGEIKD